MSVLVVGSIALDTVKTPAAERREQLGGSASYAAIAASFFGPVSLVGVVGEDFPAAHLELFRQRAIDLAGLQVRPGRTFRWAGEYHADLNTRTTLCTELNVFETFSPELPPAYREARIVLLANIAPSLQAHVLDQMRRPEFVVADTMNLWIDIARADLLALLKRVDLLILNDGEARQLTGHDNLIVAGRALLAMGPHHVALKKGEHGCLLFGPGGDGDFFSCAAYPLPEVCDPTGAGDVFAGGVAGFLAAAGGAVTPAKLRQAVAHGSVLASFDVEAFSLDRLRELGREDIDARVAALRRLTAF